MNNSRMEHFPNENVEKKFTFITNFYYFYVILTL